jgi:dihydrodipicolinate synthase/N-acetylneuraminate lyase
VSPRLAPSVLATVVVPWTAELELDEGLFRREIERLLAAGYRQLYIFGTAGEGYAVDDQTFAHVSRVFVQAMTAGGAEPMIGVISPSLDVVRQRIAFARDTLGVTRFQVSLPNWGVLTLAEVRTFFDAVLGSFRECSFLHYNLMRAGRLLTGAEYAVLAADHPNLVATKNSTDSMQRIRDLLDQAAPLQHFLNERGFCYGSLIGECGLLISVGTTNLAQGQRYFAAGRARDLETLLRLEGELHEIARTFHACVAADGVARIDGAYDKVLWALHEPRFPLRLRPPYAGAAPAVVDEFRAALVAHWPGWAPDDD